MNLPQNEFNPYYLPYIILATSENIIEGLQRNLKSVTAFYKNIPEEKHNYAYAEGKWTVKDILLHIIDTERIFAYRALRIGRNDKTLMRGFEQDDYVISGNASARTMESLINEYMSVRHSTISLYKSFSQNDLKCMGTASNSPVSVRAIGYIISGHENHHNRIIEERYLN
ncbi:MAG: DinB family protein [Winogradskyella sp.]|uniref:DinB family protein n=1 Tax=Winogradskyella sp. TaxID=1883156 RepID=UPI0017BCDAA1|nr:DinB family protein [Winogradskyella sp.]MBT8245567.1 DinB family protein [Winogradskyella sp.]NNK22580.1 DinB family protein [Winogradskyella sp.]